MTKERERKTVSQEALDAEEKARKDRHPSYAQEAPILAEAERISVTEAEKKLDAAAATGQPTAQGKVEAAKEDSPKTGNKPTTESGFSKARTGK